MKTILIKKVFFFRDQGITDPQKWTCANTIGNARISGREKLLSSHLQEHSGFPDLDYDGKKSETCVGKKQKKSHRALHLYIWGEVS